MPDMDVADAMFQDGRWVETITLFKQGSTSNTDGYAIPGDGDDVGDGTFDAIIRPARARKYQFLMEGRADGGEYLMIAKTSAIVEQGDEVDYNGMRYNVQSPETDILDGFTIFELHEVVN